MVHGRRALPEPTDLTAPHWTSGASGRLLVQRCARCGGRSFPPVPLCRRCGAADLVFEPVTGKGVLVSWTAVRGAWPGRGVEVVAVVDLVEGVTLLLGLVDADADDLRVGTPVRLVFAQVDDRIWLPLAEVEESEPFAERIEVVS